MRIWWCTTGPLMSLPLHAAGVYEDPHPESVFDYAISSYIPTISIWTDRGQHSRKVSVESTGICMVSQEAAPGLPHIPGTRKEIARVAAMVSSEPDVRAVRLEDGAATKAAVLAAMENHNWIHLACHGCQDPNEPLKSGFALADGRLESSTIIKHNSKYAEFAFLSACQTSTGDDTLSEESVHLAAAMLVAGYRGVVGTLWSINDRHAPDVAEDFYRELLARSRKVEGKMRLDGEQAAYALHYAVQRLRKRVGHSNYLVWAPYVHLGV
jgi:CHAT domain-containing protein